jgi:hypothetical protein
MRSDGMLAYEFVEDTSTSQMTGHAGLLPYLDLPCVPGCTGIWPEPGPASWVGEAVSERSLSDASLAGAGRGALPAVVCSSGRRESGA